MFDAAVARDFTLQLWLVAFPYLRDHVHLAVPASRLAVGGVV